MDGSNFIVTARPQQEASAQVGLERETIIAKPEPAAADLPKAVGFAVIGAFGFAMLSFMTFFGGSAQSLFMTAISLAYLVAYVTVPVIFFRIPPKTPKQVNWEQFMAKGLDTWTGHLTGKEAFVQIMTIPGALIVAATAMGIALHLTH